MTGLIQSQMAPQPPDQALPPTDPASQSPAAPGGDSGAPITPESIEKQLHLNPQQKQQLQRLVVAGLKVMFSQQTRQLLMQAMQGDAPVAQKLGQGIAGLMGLLFHESQGAMPQNLLVPAGMVLLVHAADFLRKAGQPVTNQDIAQALEVFIRTVMQGAGVDTDKLGDIASRGPQQAPPPGGIVNDAQDQSEGE